MIRLVQWYRLRVAALCVLMLVAFQFGYAGTSDVSTIKINLGPYKLEIPEANSLEGNAPFWVEWIPGLDSEVSSTNIMFAPDEVAALIPGLVLEQELFGTLHYVTQEEYNRTRQHPFGVDLWYGRGAHQYKIFEPWEGTDLYRSFYARHDKKVFWEVTRGVPDPDRPPPDDIQEFFVANCSGDFDAGKSSCSTSVMFDRLLVEFSIEEPHLLRLEGIRQFIQVKVSSWVVEGQARDTHKTDR